MHTSNPPMQKSITIKPKMKRKQVLVYLVFAILLLIATLPSHSTAFLAIDAESAGKTLSTIFDIVL